ncbi:MAG TPA: adenylate/guanylate cyclase domain-containing protein [Acidimicrobiia bacterium]
MTDEARAWAAAGLYDPSAPDAEDQLELLRYLRERGAGLDDLRRAKADGRLVGLAGDLTRRAAPRLRLAEIAREAGVDERVVVAVSRAAGLPAYDDAAPVFRPEDAEVFRIAAQAMAVFGEEPMLEFSRTLGAALSAVADAAMAMFGIEIAGRFDERGVTQVARAAAAEAATVALTEQVPAVMRSLLFHHVEAALGRGTGTHTLPLAVGFVDLVRSTALVQELAPDEVASVIGTFERLAMEVVVAHGGRVVKTIGDEVMFVVPDVVEACDAALAFRGAVAAEERLPAVRGGLASGDLVRGYGDFYGPDVTLAARIVKLASPGALLVTEEVRAAADRAFRFEPAGEHLVRGFAEPVALFLLERG